MLDESPLPSEAMLLHLLKLKGIEAPQGLKKLTAELLERVNLTFAAILTTLAALFF